MFTESSSSLGSRLRVAIRVGLYSLAAIVIWGTAERQLSRWTADEHWLMHERVIVMAGEGRIVANDLAAACRFFSELTSIQIPLDKSDLFETYSIQDVPGLLAKLRAWHDLHRDQLYWDEDDQRVVVRPKYFFVEAWRWLFASPLRAPQRAREAFRSPAT
jgi:hypothetical protein